MQSFRTVLRFASAMAALTLCAQVRGQDASLPSSEIKLGAIPGFASEAAAVVACSPDGVVWADRKSGFFYPKFVAEYGKTAHGTYTCFAKAREADYWSLTPTPEDGHRGREFPMFFCYACS